MGTFGRDDAIMIFAFAVIITYVASLSAAVAAGYGNHLQDIPPDERPLAIFRTTLCSCLAVLTFAFPKVAIVALLERLLELHVVTRVIFWGLSVSLVACSVLLSIFWFVQCTPRAHQWDLQHVPGSCWDPSVVLNLSYFTGFYSGVIDVLFAVYPSFIIWRLQMPMYRKVVISASLGGGLIAAVAAFYKMTHVSELSEESKTDPTCRPSFFISFKAAYMRFHVLSAQANVATRPGANVPLLVWTSIEAQLLVITASIPTIGPFIRFARNRCRQYTSSGGLEGSTVVNKSYQTASRPRQHRSAFGSRSHAPHSEQDVLLVDIERSNPGSLPQVPDRTRAAHNEIWKETEVEVSHGTMDADKR